jgi:hypothetical protein
VFIAMHDSVQRRRNYGNDAAIVQHFSALDAVVGTVGDDPINREVRWQDTVHSFAIGHARARDLDRAKLESGVWGI